MRERTDSTTEGNCTHGGRTTSGGCLAKTGGFRNSTLYCVQCYSEPFSHCRFPAPAPFSHPDWVFEIKWDGFRALLYSDSDGVRLVSRNRNTFKSFPSLCEGLVRDLKGRRNHGYSQWVGRVELFEHERRSDPDFQVWDGCTLACAEILMGVG